MSVHEILFNDNKTEITHIYHISDILIKLGDERFDEYVEVVDNLTNILKNKPKNLFLSLQVIY